ncbi:MAG: CidA/LrgA family protein [Candidatus Gastranaerophilales bacterium]|nr:CidA/LrgA family protein [Candidatus Gastranaerophilales bacterium]
MKNFVIGLGIIFLILYLSKIILDLAHIAFPAPILGIIILFILLKIGIIKEVWIESFCNFMLKNMILFFIPIFVGVIAYTDIISKNFLAIIMTIIITTTLVMVVVGLLSYNIIKYQRLRRMKK